ncbi:hypothetical protein [Nocardioides nematodiphilus]|uniref:hypothetical protein n=1 Tax=Nocardioides nematodiphilus TaxID=2849669 RepID=UPI001CD91B99|nr:hypothetical protein [Nocardioides nematodiphilus]MCA1984706.1 hypothetical protein [Nocardioides nematodiphilus]
MKQHALHSPDRGAAILGLVVTAGTHLPLVGEHLEEAPYVGWLFIALSAAALVLALALVIADTPLVWAVAGAVTLAAVVAFVASRTIGLPLIGDDVGNWSEPLGYPAVAAEVVVAVVSAMTLLRTRRVPTLGQVPQ